MIEDPGLEPVREVRRKISRECNHDPGEIVRHYMKLQEQYKDRLLHGPESDRSAAHEGSPTSAA